MLLLRSLRFPVKLYICVRKCIGYGLYYSVGKKYKRKIQTSSQKDDVSTRYVSLISLSVVTCISAWRKLSCKVCSSKKKVGSQWSKQHNKMLLLAPQNFIAINKYMTLFSIGGRETALQKHKLPWFYEKHRGCKRVRQELRDRKNVPIIVFIDVGTCSLFTVENFSCFQKCWLLN